VPGSGRILGSSDPLLTDLARGAILRSPSHPLGRPPPMPLVRRLLESSLYCDDLARTLRFYHGVLELPLLFEDQRLAALDAGAGTVLLLFRSRASGQGASSAGGWIPPHDGSGPVHLAFAIEAGQLGAIERQLAAAATPIESRVEWPGGGKSIYCRDPDRHSLEFATPGIWSVY
jgi:catechol 2,3-dioxygenase-like lactoylglutathione lyase family enzyme